jgi:ABC-type branched-subunit amino acid transport system ATPase component
VHKVGKLLQIKNLDKSFGGVHAINHLSFDVEEGEILGLIGPNGSGKSTCVNLITGVYIQDSGEMVFQGKYNLKKQTVPDRAFLGLGRTFQSPKPFTNLTVFDSVYTIAMLHQKTKRLAAEKTNEILDFLGFTDAMNLPCSKLPIEKRKWLDMARVLAIEPKLLMLDECLAGLTPSEMDESLQLVRQVNNKGITILFIEHVMAAVTKLCHRVVVLSEGSLLTEGDPNIVMRDPSVIKAYLGEEYEHA